MRKTSGIAPTIWLTGVSGSGKTTLARGLEGRFQAVGVPVEVLDGDELRELLSKGLGFTQSDREIHALRISYIAKLLTRHQVTVIVAAISPYRNLREAIKESTPEFIEIYCACPLETAEQRDVKGLYQMAREGRITHFTGISDVYEAPVAPALVVRTHVETVEESLNRIWAFLNSPKVLKDEDSARAYFPHL